jgi:hypothetical protein
MSSKERSVSVPENESQDTAQAMTLSVACKKDSAKISHKMHKLLVGRACWGDPRKLPMVLFFHCMMCVSDGPDAAAPCASGPPAMPARSRRRALSARSDDLSLRRWTLSPSAARSRAPANREQQRDERCVQFAATNQDPSLGSQSACKEDLRHRGQDQS